MIKETVIVTKNITTFFSMYIFLQPFSFSNFARENDIPFPWDDVTLDMSPTMKVF